MSATKTRFNYVEQIFGLKFPFDPYNFDFNASSFIERAKKMCKSCTSEDETKLWEIAKQQCSTRQDKLMGEDPQNCLDDYHFIAPLIEFYQKKEYPNVKEGVKLHFIKGDVGCDSMWIHFPRFSQKAFGSGCGTKFEISDDGKKMIFGDKSVDLPTKEEKQCLKDIFSIIFGKEPEEEPAFHHLSTLE